MASDPAGDEESNAVPNDGTDLDLGVAGTIPRFKVVARLGFIYGLFIICNCCLGGAHLLLSRPGCLPAMRSVQRAPSSGASVDESKYE